jgi:hypothetical protein
MKRSPLAWGSRSVALALLLACFCCVPASGSQPPAGAAPLDYLFVIDTSLSMSRHAEIVQKWIFELIYSGLEGHLKPGSSYSFWTFNETVHARAFNTKVWSPELNRLLAEDAIKFIRTQHYEKRTFFHLLSDELKSVAKANPNLTILLVTDGRDTLKGTPFDAQINAAFSRVVPRRPPNPLLILLSSYHGKPVAWSINLPGKPLGFPDLSPLLDETKPTVVETPTLAAPVVEAPAKAAEHPPVPPQAELKPPPATVTSSSAPVEPVVIAPPVPEPITPAAVKPTEPPPPAAAVNPPPISPATAVPEAKSPPPTQPPSPGIQANEPSTPSTPVASVTEDTATPPPVPTPTVLPPVTTPPISEPKPQEAAEIKSAPAATPNAVAAAPSAATEAPSSMAPAEMPASVPPAAKPAAAAKPGAVRAPASLNGTPAAMVTPAVKSRSSTLIMTGLVLVVAAFGLLGLQWRSRRAPRAPSLISQTLDGKK